MNTKKLMPKPENHLALLDRIVIVLVGTSDPGNIGSAARAMKTMGLTKMRLVAPVHAPEGKAFARASGADDVMNQAETYTDLGAAIGDCVAVIGASARLRSLPWPVEEPREAAEIALAELAADDEGGKVAFVFGREKSGLSNEELELCRLLVHIPANPDYSSLNLAASVQVIAYELRVAALSGSVEPVIRETPLAPAEDVERFFTHLEQVLTDVGFLKPHNPKQLMRRLRRLFHRAELDQNEANILRGVLTAVERSRQSQ